jgi:hypothetical protein
VFRLKLARMPDAPIMMQKDMKIHEDLLELGLISFILTSHLK